MCFDSMQIAGTDSSFNSPTSQKLIHPDSIPTFSRAKTGDIADILNIKVGSLGPLRARLLKKGMIYSPAYGDMAFTVPLFDEFMIRAIPSLK